MNQYVETYFEIYPEIGMDTKQPKPCYYLGNNRYVDANGSFVSGPSINEYIVDCRPKQ